MKRIHRSLLISLILTSLESRTEMVSAISSFVDFLNSDASASLSSEDVPSYLFMTSDFVEHWNHRKKPQQTLHDYWVHEMPQYSAKAFIAEDVERVFTPLGNITNIADISVFSTNAEE